ncbi:MAG: tetratricopeptide repeat protein [Bdellovibrionales bacterium]|nr:tetratricopeptide repeat protein [Bdellovibrionales bacterium]NQZ20067.1 tetratricopeptide repeat protein [Bdellovibrionales bacterium]
MMKVMMRILCLLILISLSGCLEKPETRIFNQATKAFVAKDFKKSSQLYEKLLVTSTNKELKLKATSKLANIYDSSGDFDKLKKKLQYIVVNSKDRNQRMEAKQKMADVEFYKRKNYSEAISHYSELIELNFNKYKNQLMVSRCYYYQNNFEQSMFELKRVLKETANKEINFEANLLKGHILFAEKKYALSSEIYSDLVEGYPRESKASFVLLNLAMSQEESGNYTGAIASLQELQTFYHSPDFLAAKILHIQKKKSLMPGGKGRLKR